MILEEEIKQTKFKDVFEKVQVNLLFTANWMNARLHHQLKPYGISSQQFNILRILRGQKGRPVALKLITERMLDKMSNTSRLVDKMMLRGLLEREICHDNRRQVDIRLTEKGLSLCVEISDMLDAERNAINKFTKSEATEFNRLLDKMRL